MFFRQYDLASLSLYSDSLARDLHRSLQDELLTLPDATQVYPAHGAGSACGKHLSTAATTSCSTTMSRPPP